jgi:hypothetical protein
MKYFTKLKVWKCSNCVFDGVKAFSYEWYCIALVLPSGKKVVNADTYSPTTGNHIRKVESLLGSENVVYLTAPRGLDNVSATRRALENEITSINEVLARGGRNKVRQAKRDSLKDRLVTIVEEQRLNEEIDLFLHGGKITLENVA